MLTNRLNLHRHAHASLKVLLLLAFYVCGFASQAAIVKGTVTDESGEPLIGATVMVAGSSTGVATDFDGNFEIDVPKGKAIRISYVGYISQDVKAGNSPMKIVLKEDNALLEEVVVVGYGTMKTQGPHRIHHHRQLQRPQCGSVH